MALAGTALFSRVVRFSATGDYVIPDGLSTLHIDRASDSGTYPEPDVRTRHR
jgi:hypothetical protein